MVQLDSLFSVSWTFINLYTIRFQLQGNFAGWAGIGFGPVHSAMDTYVAWITSSGSGVLQDGFSNAYSIPTSDPIQSSRIISTSRVGNQFNIIFERAMVTKDSRDLQFSYGQSITMHWAYHYSLNPETTNINTLYAQHTNYGSRQIIFPNSPTPNPPTPNPPTLNPPTLNPPTLNPPTLNPPTLNPSPNPPTYSLQPIPTLSPSLQPTINPISETKSVGSFIRGDDNFYVSWVIQGNDIQFVYDCQSVGWVGIGFDSSRKIHSSTDTYISWILTSGTGIVQDGYSSSENQPQVDIVQSAKVLNASLIGNRFRLTFERPLQSNDTLDFNLNAQEWIWMGWAYHPTANPNTDIYSAILPVHTQRGVVYKNLLSGEEQYHHVIFPSTHYILICTGFFLIYVVYRWVKRLKEQFPVGIYYKGSQKELYESPSNNPFHNLSVDKCSTWLFSRQTWLDISRVDLFFGIGLVLLNLLCWGLGMLFNFSQTEIWGYLSTANSLLVAIPATRNSFLVWITQLSIDQTIMYHRWLGRLVIIESFIHFFCALNKYALFPQKSLYGSIALGCLGVIGLTSIEYFRRKVFNFFFYSHHIFFLYYIMGSLHSGLFFIYTCVAAGIYGLDQMIRWVRGIYPRRVTRVENLTDKIMRVQFPKYKYSNQRVGQYVFLNFPQISLLEWHPFTLANGPNEPFQEVYIKNLGNHTEQLLQHVQKDSWVRVDGPYGYWHFDYTLYPHILFVCGGIGITPCLSFIRHIYEYNLTEYNTTSLKHRLRHIYLVWCCTQEEEAQWVNQELLHAVQQSQLEKYPNFDLFVFITGSSRALQNSTYHVGRPDMNRVFDTIEEHMLRDDMQLENMLVNESKACVFACGPKSLTLQTWDTWSKRALRKRYDYHQEIFEF